MGSKTKSPHQMDGGYYALKGYVFQFDKSLIEIIEDRTNKFEIEKVQDLDTHDYYLQVKYKETQNYSPSKIKKPILQLLELSRHNSVKRLRLFCYFKDRKRATIYLTMTELNTILGSEKRAHSKEEKSKFLALFTLEFSDDFNSQFEYLLERIIDSFNLKSTDEALIYHANMRAHLVEIALKNRDSRTIDFQDLKKLVSETEKTVFGAAYIKYMGNSKYLAHLRREYFTHKKPNVRDVARLFVITLDDELSDADIATIILLIKEKYYIANVSGAPYIHIDGISLERLALLKIDLWSQDMKFCDGTHFSEDEFRLKSIKEDLHLIPNNDLTYKLLSANSLVIANNEVDFEEKYHFIPSSVLDADVGIENIKKLHLENARDIKEIFK